MVFPKDVALDKEWSSSPADPDLERDLGYEMINLEVVDIPTNGQMMFLPSDEDMLRDNAFIVVSDRIVCDVIEHR